tara:strand:- start:773 stop:1762 length:990 start_codon:yes stop_codon:yes gene_type:complete
MDLLFENKISVSLKELGLVVNNEKLIEKINTLLEDDSFSSELKIALHSRIIECSKKPQTLMDKIFNKISFESCTQCDLKDSDSILYLYDEYRALLNKNTSKVNRIDLSIILVNCEVRLRLLSYYISLELLRRNKESIDKVTRILKRLYKLDQSLIEKNEIRLSERQIENNELLRKKQENQELLRKEQSEIIKGNAIIKEKIDQLGELDAKQFNDIKQHFENNTEKNKAFIEQMKDQEQNTSFKERLQKGEKLNREESKKERGDEMKGGSSKSLDNSEILEEKNKDDKQILSETYKVPSSIIEKRCENMKQTRNVRLDDLQYINHCNDGL